MTPRAVQRSRGIVYVDGYNLYYRRLRGTPYKWLDLDKLTRLIFPGWDIRGVKYFTARVRPSPIDPSIHKRQGTYLNALSTCSQLQIIEGHYFINYTRLAKASAYRRGKLRTTEVVKTEEKGSDVNLASHLLMDAFNGSFDACAVVTNDSDLCTPIEMVTKNLALPAILVTTLRKGQHPNASLRKAATSLRWLRDGALQAAQFPPSIVGKGGQITKPSSW